MAGKAYFQLLVSELDHIGVQECGSNYMVAARIAHNAGEPGSKEQGQAIAFKANCSEPHVLARSYSLAEQL